eukprot:CAMPEP_0174260252 /NCGR_PEP_ID=MMETSP0439-20130205/9397_1 /TAXON_ID=0 /ORGANISM="Stereomyxa ramosa, Strain Chinc5" /LENGTH=142 /DNA_ID=CAMNT_0015344459 /DNA_START=108 /DNA_END=536 /DNA_ORIENTATION=-
MRVELPHPLILNALGDLEGLDGGVGLVILKDDPIQVLLQIYAVVDGDGADDEQGKDANGGHGSNDAPGLDLPELLVEEPVEVGAVGAVLVGGEERHVGPCRRRRLVVRGVHVAHYHPAVHAPEVSLRVAERTLGELLFYFPI